MLVGPANLLEYGQAQGYANPSPNPNPNPNPSPNPNPNPDPNPNPNPNPHQVHGVSLGPDAAECGATLLQPLSKEP